MNAAVEEHLPGLADHLSEACTEHGLVFLDVEDTGRKRPKLTVYIYAAEKSGLTTDDCALINRIAETYLDELSEFPEQYSLEVSSPGLTRVLKKDCDFKYAKGKDVEIRIRDNGGVLKGQLLDFTAESLELMFADNTKKAVLRKDIRKANLFFSWGGKHGKP